MLFVSLNKKIIKIKEIPPIWMLLQMGGCWSPNVTGFGWDNMSGFQPFNWPDTVFDDNHFVVFDMFVYRNFLAAEIDTFCQNPPTGSVLSGKLMPVSVETRV